MMDPWRIVVADDERLMAEALRLFVETSADLRVVGIASDGREAVALVAELEPDVVLMDLAMPVMDGVEATRVICGEHPAVRVIVVTTFASPDSVVPAVRAGASGYLLKDSRPEELVAAVRDVLDGRGPVSPALTGALIEAIRSQPDPAPPASEPAVVLTPREREVLDRLAQGLSNGEMARELFLSEAAVKSRLAQIMTKFDVTSRIQVLVRACELKLVEPRLRRTDYPSRDGVA